MRADTRQRALSAPALTTARTENPDPLLALLQRYEAELAAFNRPLGTEQITDQDWDRIAQKTWSHTQDDAFLAQPLRLARSWPSITSCAMRICLRSETSVPISRYFGF
jgi:hypothetical protein